MLSIVNNTYMKLIEIPEIDVDDNIFNQLIKKSKKAQKQVIDDYKYKIKILKDVISVKEADLKKTKKDLERLDKNLAKQLDAIKKAEEKERLRKEK